MDCTFDALKVLAKPSKYKMRLMMFNGSCLGASSLLKAAQRSPEVMRLDVCDALVVGHRQKTP